MLKHRILCVGRRAKDPLLDAAENYLDRLGHYSKAEIVRVRDGTLVAETKALQKKIPGADKIIVLDERGGQRTSKQLAQWLKAWQQTSVSTIAWVIGGADGIHPEIAKRADETLSLSRLTLPHRMALAVLVEQIYRAHTILKGEPYHRD